MSLVYNIYFEVASIIFLVILFIITRLMYNMQSAVNKEFLKLILIVLLADILDVVSAITISYASVIPIWVNMLVNTMYFAVGVFVGFQFMCYCEYYIHREKKRGMLFKINRAIVTVYFCLLFVNLFTGCYFTFEADQYLHGPLYIATNFTQFYLILSTGAMLIYHFNVFKPWQRVSVLIFLVLSLIGSLIQVLLFQDVLLVFFTISIGLFLMMFTMETPDYQKLVKTIEELQRTKEIAEKAKEEAESAREMAQEANRAKTDFLANMSHEVRTPIHAILGYNEIIMEETKESATAEYAMNVRAAGRTLLSIINDILDFTNIDKGELKLENTSYYVMSFLQDAITYAEYDAQKKNLELRVSVDELLPRQLSGDVVRLMQIVNNLLSNAVKYTMEGFIEFRVTWHKKNDSAGSMEISVSDSGIGMKQEDVERISESFSRFDSRKTRDIQGIGLGLTIVTRLLKLMGGELKIDSEYGRGSTFTFQVNQAVIDETPIGRIEYKNSSKLLLQPEEEDEFIAPKAHILTVDDNIMNLELFCGILKDTKISIDTASNGEEALKLLEKNTYDIVFLDHMMPVMDGMEALREIKKRKLCPETPVIVLTANAIAGEKEMYLDAGFVDYLSKPILGRQLKQIIRYWLPDELIESIVKDSVQEQSDSRNLIEQAGAYLDTATGLTYCCDSEEFYIDMLLTYLNNQKSDSIEEAYQKEDWENYRILVHALKSTSLSIGACELSEQAKALETAAKEDDIGFIREHHVDTMEKYSSLLSHLQTILQEPEQEEQDVNEQAEALPHILVVDDDIMNLRIAEKMLKGQFLVDCVDSGKKVLESLKDKLPDLILLDLHMPDMDGFEVMRQLQADEKYRGIPVIFLTADDDRDTEVRGFQAGAMDFITKPFVYEIVLQRVSRLVELNRLQKDLEKEVRRQTAKAEERQHRVEQMSLQAVQTLARTIDAKDAYTNGHSYRVAEYSVLLARELGWQEEEVDNLRHAALLHDIGKISIPDSVLNKPTKLTDEEYSVIKSHAAKGGEILKCITAIPGADLVARHHHEKYDGTGYPDGLKGEQIPKSARIVAIADAYDAMSSRRIYRKGLSNEIIREELVKGTGTQFEPESLEVFIRLFDEGRLVIQEYAENEVQGDTSEEVSTQLLQQVVKTIHDQQGAEECDSLTGLLLRNVGETQIAEAMQEENGCLAFIDVDNLKKINDTIGHKAGDRLLTLVGSILAEYSQNSIACRLGGDEFLLYMKGITRDGATERVENIIETFRKKKDEDIAVRQASLSAGLCMTTPLDVYADVYNKADKALYHVKCNGKAGYSFYRKEDYIEQSHDNVDLLQVMEALKNSGDYAGAMNVEYREFAKMFEYVGNLQHRYKHDVHLLMITLENQTGETLYIDELEETMVYMEIAIRETIRTADICTRYSNVQYLVILLEAGNSNVKTIVDHIFHNFFKRCDNKKLKPVYSALRADQED